MLKAVFVSIIFSAFTFASPVAPQIQYVGAITVNAAQDAKVLADWYQKFGIALQPMGNMYWGEFDTAAGKVAFAIHPSEKRHAQRNSGSISVAYSVNDFEAYVAMVESRGLKATKIEPPSEYGRFAYYTDPDGNEVKIWGH